MIYLRNKQTTGVLILLITALIWGFAFPFQRQAMEYLGPYTFNAIRFLVASVALLPLLLFFKPEKTSSKSTKNILYIGAIGSGVFLFLGSASQQIGLVYTTAGKAGFITGFYLIIVPFIGWFLKHSIGLNVWVGAMFALFGLYLLSVDENLVIEKGDLYVLACSFFWALQIIILDWASPKVDSLRLAFYQFSIVAILSVIVALSVEQFTLQGIKYALIPILYTGILSTSVAFTLQIIGQKMISAAPASIILSLEALFAAIGGWLLLGEIMDARALSGCALMMLGLLLSQVSYKTKNT